MFQQKMQAKDKRDSLAFFLVELGMILNKIPYKTKLP